MAAEPKDTPEQVALYKDLAIVLYRIARHDEEAPDTREWNDARKDFVKRARRLGRALDRYGFDLTRARPEGGD